MARHGVEFRAKLVGSKIFDDEICPLQGLCGWPMFSKKSK